MTPDAFIRESFWIVLGRDPDDVERDAFRQHHQHGGEAHVLQRLLSSPEFHLIFSGWRDDIGIGKDPAVHEAGLRSLGSNDHFVRRAYSVLLGRDADDAGRAHYVKTLDAGEARRQILRVFVTSDEFEARYRPIASQEGGGFVPRDVQLCELANPAKWANPEWMALMSTLVVQPADQQSMHRKGYEFTQLLFGLSRLGFLREDVRVLSVGAGHEAVLYWLANRTQYVVATDMYGGVWQSHGAREGDETVISDPRQYAPFPYREDRLVFLKMDGTSLAFADGTFDVVYSLSSIEHFGGVEGASRAVAEMARVLKPGGVVALATEYLLEGPPHHEAFTPAQVRLLLQHPDRALVEPVDERVWERYQYKPIDLRVNPLQTPHMVVTDNGSVFTSVMAFLRKREPETPAPQ